MEQIIEKLKANMNRSSTAKNYLCIWRQLNKFLIQLDHIPDQWEDRVAFFCAYLIEVKKVQSSTLKSYISAIKHTLKCDKYEWKDERVWLNALTRSCKLANDRIATRFPIHFKLLEAILFEIQRSEIGKTQPYLCCLYQTILCLSYYGLMRIGEVTDSDHVMKARNVFIADNKDKIIITLFSLKTHGKESRPQEIKISAFEASGKTKTDKFFCPFQLMRRYMKLRGSYIDDDENFFVFRDRTPVMHVHVRKVLKDALLALNLNADCYNCQSTRIGRATDLLHFGYNVETIKIMGRWKSNAVYKYLRPI